MNEEQMSLPIDDDLPILDFKADRGEEETAEQRELLTIYLFKHFTCEVKGN